MMIYKKALLKTSRWIAFTFAGAVLISVILFCALQLRFTIDLVLGIVNRSLFDNGIRIEVNGMKGIVPFSFKVEELSIFDRSGRWIQLLDCSIKIVPYSMLEGHVYAETIHIGKVVISRFPDKKEQKEKTTLKGLNIPPIVSRIIIADIQAPEIILDKGILGEPSRFRLAGGATERDTKGFRNYHLDISRIDSVSESLKVSMLFSVSQQHSSLNIDVREPGKGILYQLTGMGEDFRLLMDGKGDLSQWNGTLNFSSEEIGEVSSVISVKAVKEYHLNMIGHLIFSGNLVSEKYRGITGREAEFKIDANPTGKNGIAFNLFEVKAGEVEAMFKGTIDREDLDADLGFTLKINDLASVASLTGLDSAGVLAVEGLLNGSILRPIIRLSYNAEGFRGKGLSAGTLSGSGQIDLSRNKKSKKGISISGEGEIEDLSLMVKDRQYHEKKISSSFSLIKDPEEQVYVGQVKIDSDRFSALASGSADIETWKRSLEGKILIDFLYGDHNIKTGAQFYLAGNDISFREVFLKGAGIESGGSIDFDLAKRLLEGKVDFSIADLGEQALIPGKNISGALTGDVTLKTNNDLQDAGIHASGNKLSVDRAYIDEMEITSVVSDLFNVVHHNTDALIKGVTLGGIQLKTLDLKAHGKRDAAELALRGSGTAGRDLFFDMSAGITNQDQGIFIKIHDLQGRFGATEALLTEPVNILYSGNEININNIDMNIDSGHISGALDYTPDKMGGHLKVKRMPLSLLTLAGVPALNGLINGDLHLGGDPVRPEISGNVEVEGIIIKKDLDNHIPPVHLKVEYFLDKTLLTGKFNIGGVPGSSMSGSISIPWSFSLSPFTLYPRDSEPLHGSVTGELDLAVATSVLGAYNQTFAGIIDTDIDIAGTYRSPVISGKATLSKGSYENTGMGILFRNIDADISIAETGLTLNNLIASDRSDGKVTGKGRLDIDPKRDYPYELLFKLADTQLTESDRLKVFVDGNTMLSGTIKEHNLSGNLDIEKAEIVIPDKLPVEITDIEIREINQKGDALPDEKDEDPVKSNVKFDLAVSSPGRVYIKGRGLDSEWKGKIRVEGTSGRPLITGRLSTVRGYYNFLSRPFNLTEGQVTFLGNSPPDPYFDVTGKSVSKSITAFINIKGNIANPVLRLYSEPAMPQDEILARALFDREVSQITPLQALQLAAALNEMLGKKKGLDPLAYTRDLIGVDRLEVKQSNVNPDESALSAGKYLKDNIYIEVEKGVGEESGKASVTWELTPRVTIETGVGENDEAGIGVNWKYDF
ncbi:MAG: translocation/assembly module TamB domain-containing protein [Deltaproteobacteria bacterium]|nr:translocation/assembly module TamB domain-containing protein [Deltaproteobacteria bacterium]